MIKMQVIGHLGKDAIVNDVNGKNVINFSCCHTEKYKDAQGVAKEKSTWVDCSYWTDKTAIAPYLKKGTQVYIEGNPDARIYDKADGSKMVALTLRVMSVQLLGGGGEKPTTASQVTTPSKQQEPAPVADDLPF